MTATDHPLPRRPRSGGDRYQAAIAAGHTPGDALAAVVVELVDADITNTALAYAVTSAVGAHLHHTAPTKD
jgi:hypothetical protein